MLQESVLEGAPKLVTQLVIIIFFLGFLLFLIQKTIKASIDLFDLFFLVLLGLVPVGFGVFPNLGATLTRALGVSFPFVVLFGLLHLIMFIYITYLASRINKLRRNETKLVQKIALLENDLNQQTTANTGKK